MVLVFSGVLGSILYDGVGLFMKIVTIKQNTRIWHAWRGKGLGASDAPIIMGDSPWATPFQLWGQKTGLLPKTEPNAFALAAMRRGQDMEPEARAAYERSTGRSVEPIAGEHETYSFLRASLDGATGDLQHMVEIKCPGIEAHNKAKKGKVPEYYYAQVQHQYLVTGAKTADYFSYRPGDAKPEVIIAVPRDEAYIAEMLGKLQAFWALVEAKTPPPVTNEDIEGLQKEVTTYRLKLADAVRALELAKSYVKPEELPEPGEDGFVKVS